jgi:hypothetical protein
VKSYTSTYLRNSLHLPPQTPALFNFRFLAYDSTLLPASTYPLHPSSEMTDRPERLSEECEAELQRLAVRYHNPPEGSVELLKAKGMSVLELMPQKMRDEVEMQKVMIRTMMNDKKPTQASSKTGAAAKSGDDDVDGKRKRTSEKDEGKQTAKKPRVEKGGDVIMGDEIADEVEDTTTKPTGIPFRLRSESEGRRRHRLDRPVSPLPAPAR